MKKSYMSKLEKKRWPHENRIVFVNRYYWPDASATSQMLTDLAEFLAGNGTKVIVVTGKRFYHYSKSMSMNRETKNQVEIRRVVTTSFGNNHLIGKFIDFVTFYISASIVLFFLVRRGDTVVAKTDPPLIGLFVWAIGRIRGAKIYNWCQDLFPEIADALGVVWTKGLIGTAIQGMRNYSLQKSRMNIVVSETMKGTLIAQGVDRNRITVIRNWPDRNIKPIEPMENALRNGWGLGDKFVLGYSGNLGRAHSAERIYELVQLLKDVVDLKLLFVGAGHGMKWLERECTKNSYQHVLFKPHQPREMLSDSLSAPDIHIVSLSERCQRYLFPSKFYGILAAGRPVLFLGKSNTEIAREVKIGQFGAVLDPEMGHSWRKQILSLKANAKALNEMKQRARLVYENRFADKLSLSVWQNVLNCEHVSPEIHQNQGAVEAKPT